MIRVIHTSFTASARILAQSNATEQLDELGKLAARAAIAALHPGFAALSLRLLALYQAPSELPGDTLIMAMYAYTLIRAPLSA